jgi:GntR family transcriptional regulator
VQPIDKSSPIPFYQQLAAMLRHEIEEHRTDSDVFQLPSENELSEQHGISRATVRHALDVLARDGWIYREKGKGAFAALRRVEQELTHLVSTTEDMRSRGWSLVTQVVSVERMRVPDHVAHALELGLAEEVFELVRLRIVNGEPMSLQTAYLPCDLCPKLEEDDLTLSLYRLLESRYGLRLWTAEGILRARCASPFEAEWLQIAEAMPVIDMERITYAVTGAAVEYLEAAWRGDRYDFKVSMVRPQ